jgi:geranylgeranyl diphosphate synthase, type I
MNLKESYKTFQLPIEETLRKVVDRSVGREYAELREMLSYHMGWEGEGAGPDARGKRIRPMLVLLCAECTNGNWKAALPAAAAVELIHNFSLIHDDIQDQSPLRRGRPTVWKKWGIAQAINAGDVMYTQSFFALRGLAETVSLTAAFEAHSILEDTCLRLTEGQYLDMAYESKPVLPMTAYWPMISGKTSALLGCCAEFGALSAGADPERRENFRQFGISLGLAFQVLDDWLGIWGDEEMTGKSAQGDLVSGKKTLPVVYALEQGGDFARRWIQGSITAADVPEAVRMLDAVGAGTFTLEKASELTHQAQAALKRAVPDDEASTGLRELTQSLLKRNK